MALKNNKCEKSHWVYQETNTIILKHGKVSIFQSNQLVNIHISANK